MSVQAKRRFGTATRRANEVKKVSFNIIIIIGHEIGLVKRYR